MTEHFKMFCLCGKMLYQCKCPNDYKRTDVTATCEHQWARALEDELSEQYNIPANAEVTRYHQSVAVELPATRHKLDVSLHGLYGFIITLEIYDETGGKEKEFTWGTCLKENDLADIVSNIYNGYEG